MPRTFCLWFLGLGCTKTCGIRGHDDGLLSAQANQGDGVLIHGGAHDNIVGLLSNITDQYRPNVISGNTGNGVDISGSSTDGNTVFGNYIGAISDQSGTVGSWPIAFCTGR